MITDHLMPDVLRSTTTTPGELCVIMDSAIQTQKLPAICSDLGEIVFRFTLFNMFQGRRQGGGDWCVKTPP